MLYLRPRYVKHYSEEAVGFIHKSIRPPSIKIPCIVFAFDYPIKTFRKIGKCWNIGDGCNIGRDSRRFIESTIARQLEKISARNLYGISSMVKSFAGKIGTHHFPTFHIFMCIVRHGVLYQPIRLFIDFEDVIQYYNPYTMSVFVQRTNAPMHAQCSR